MAYRATAENIPDDFDRIPNEIISLIANKLTVDIHAPYVPYGSEERTLPVRDEHINPRRDLMSLCLVSRRMRFIAQKALYRNIFITDADTLVLLYRSFLENLGKNRVLGNRILGNYVKQMSLNISHTGDLTDVDNVRVYESAKIDLGPILTNDGGLNHGLGEHLTAAAEDNRIAPCKIPIAILYTLQFKVLGCTRNLESLDLNVHPQYTPGSTYERYNMDDTHSEVVSEVLHSMWWEETSLCLMSLKKLHLIRAENPPWAARSNFVALICRCFLTLPKLEQLIWFNHSSGWLDELPRRMVSGKPWTICCLSWLGS